MLPKRQHEEGPLFPLNFLYTKKSRISTSKERLSLLCDENLNRELTIKTFFEALVAHFN